MENYLKGLEYEKFVCNHINKTNEAWLWNNIPEYVLDDAKLILTRNELRKYRKDFKNNKNKINPFQEIGIDILEKINEGYKIVQCKNYINNIKIDDLAGFWMMMAAHPEKKGAVYYPNDISSTIKKIVKIPNIEFIKLPMKEIKIINKKNKIIPLDYQINAVELLNKHFKENNRGILHMPCGTGKTFVSCLFSKIYTNVIILSPLKQFAKQNLDRFIEYDQFESILIDSDGSRDINDINSFIKKNKNKRCVFSSTYKSIDIVNKFIDRLNNVIVIIDEFHNLSKNNINDINDYFYKLLDSDHKILSMSATPRIYDLEDINEETYILGNIVYSMDFKTAIEKKLICDYKIYVPSVHEELDGFFKEIDNEIDISKIDKSIQHLCCYFFNCLTKYGSKKCILYFKSYEEIDNFKKAFKEYNKFYALDYNINSITYNDTHNSRNTKLKEFSESKIISILCSIEILDECIDIPSCDSVFITYASKSKIRTIQRISRSTRLDQNNKYKIARIYLWCNNNDEIKETIASLKEFDPNLVEKVVLETTNINNNTDPNNIKKIKMDIEDIRNLVIDVKEYKKEQFNTTYKKVELFVEINKKIPSSGSKNVEEKILGIWCATIRQYKKLNKLDSDKVKLFENIKGWFWTENNNRIHKTFEEYYNELKKWIKINKRIQSNK